MPWSLTHLSITNKYIKRKKNLSEIEKIQFIIWSILPDILKNLSDERNNSHFCWEYRQREITTDKIIKNFINVNWTDLNYVMLSYLFHLIIDHTWTPWIIKDFKKTNKLTENEKEEKTRKKVMLTYDKIFFHKLSEKSKEDISNIVRLSWDYINSWRLNKNFLPKNYQDINIWLVILETQEFIDSILRNIWTNIDKEKIVDNSIISYNAHEALSNIALKQISEIKL